MRGLTDPVEEPREESDGSVPSVEDVMQYLDRLSLLVRDIDTRLSTLERNLFQGVAPSSKGRKIFKGL